MSFVVSVEKQGLPNKKNPGCSDRDIEE